MTAPQITGVVPIGTTIGEVQDHRLDVLSLEVWTDWFDLRFARVATSAQAVPLARRVPPHGAWQVSDDRGTTYEVVDAVGRGDRQFSNGEVRLRPTLAREATSLRIVVDLGPGSITADVSLPPRP